MNGTQASLPGSDCGSWRPYFRGLGSLGPGAPLEVGVGVEGPRAQPGAC